MCTNRKIIIFINKTTTMAKQILEKLKADIRTTNPGRDSGQRRGFKLALDNIIDSTLETQVATLTAVSESTVVSTTLDLPPNSLITEITKVVTSAVTIGTEGFLAVNIGSASLGTDGFEKANITAKNHRQFMGVASTGLSVGCGSSTNAEVARILNSPISHSTFVDGGLLGLSGSSDKFFADGGTLHLQLSSSGPSPKGFADNTGEVKVAVTYRVLA